jgi:hypothetical protein
MSDQRCFQGSVIEVTRPQNVGQLMRDPARVAVFGITAASFVPTPRCRSASASSIALRPK